MEKNYITKDFFNTDESVKPYTTIQEDEEYYYLKTMVFRQSSRTVYRSVLSFWDVNLLCQHTPIKPREDKSVLLNINDIKNRYLEKKHSQEILLYIKENVDDFILPNLTTVVNQVLPIVYDVNKKESIDINIFEELERNNGCIMAFIKLSKEKKFTISDGNHRTHAIHELINNKFLDKSIEGLYIGIDFYLETDKEKEKNMFVTLNTNKPIDPSLMALLKEKDLISYSVKCLLGVNENYKYIVENFYPGNEKYIGIDLVNDNISKSNNALSFNMIKNILSILSLDMINGDKKFQEVYYNNKIEYMKFMKKASAFLNYIFTNCEPFNKIKSNQENIKNLRQEYISMTGAGIYIISKLGHVAVKYDDIDAIKVAEALCSIDWRRAIKSKPNNLFVGGIMTSEGKISNNRTAINTTTEKIKDLLGLSESDIDKIIKDR